jgi:hypothetical protein
MSERLHCSGEPVSWLRLERYHLGELEGPQRTQVETHLAACPACSECLRRIELDDAAPLPPLELPSAAKKGSSGRVLQFRASRVSAIVFGLAAAAAVMLGASRTWLRDPGADLRPGSPRVKGGDVTFSLVSDDGERVVDDTGLYQDGNRWKVMVTCPPTLSAGFDVVVLDDAGASFPLAPVPLLACGNEVPLPGAFRLTGPGEETVCIVWSPGGASARPENPKSATELGPDSRCKRLHAAPSPLPGGGR